MATLVAVGALHVAAFYAVITGLSVAFVPHDEPLPIRATNSPLPPPPAPEPRSKAHRSEREITTVFTPLPTPMPTVLPTVLPTSPAADPQPRTGDDGSGGAGLPPLKPTPSSALPRAARPLGQPGGWVTEADYPTGSIRLGHSGVVGFALAISATGRATGCEITRSSGFAELDALTCSLLLRRSRFQPATDDQGAATAGRYASAVRWQIPD